MTTPADPSAPLRSLRLQVAAEFEPIAHAALPYAQSTVAAISRSTEVCVEVLPALSGSGGRSYRLVINDEPIPAVRYPLPATDDARAAELRWQLFWAAFDRSLPVSSAAPLTLLGTGAEPAAAQAVEFARALSLGWPAPGVEPDSEPLRLRFGVLTTPHFDMPDDDRRGARSLPGTLRRAAAALMDEGTATAFLDRVALRRPRLAQAVHAFFDMPLFTAILRCLVDEGVSLRPARALCEGLLAVNCVLPLSLDHDRIVFAPPALGQAWAASSRDELTPDEWAQCAREALRSQNTMASAAPALDFRESWGMTLYRPEWNINVALLDPDFEQRMRDGAFGSEDVETIIDAMCQELEPPAVWSARVPLLTTACVRHRLWRLIRHALPWHCLLAYQELSPEASIQPLVRISVP